MGRKTAVASPAFRRGDNLAAKLPADKGCHQSHTQFPECADL